MCIAEADKDPQVIHYSSACLGIQKSDLTTLLPATEVPMGRYDEAFKPYLHFVTYFLRNSVQRRFFDRNKVKFALGDYVSIPDEAFALITIDNNWSKWNDMAATDKWDKNQVKSEYTQVLDKSGKVKNIEWNDEGIKVYNEYYQAVAKYRKTDNYKVFERYFLQQCVQELTNGNNGEGQEPRRCPGLPRPKAMRELLTFTSSGINNLRQDAVDGDFDEVRQVAC